MKTFITSSSLAILSAVVFAWFLVQTGEELPRRSPDSYPPMGGEATQPIPEVSQPAIERIGEVASGEDVQELVAVEEGGMKEKTVERSTPEEKEERAEAAEESETVSREEMGPPAPVLPFVLNINAAEEGVSLQGSIPTREMKKAVLSSIGAVFEEGEIDSRLKFSPETRSGLWISYLPDFLERYFRYTAGMQEVTVVDGMLILNGAVASDEAKETILKWAEPLGNRGLEIEDRVDVDQAVGSSIEEIPGEVAGSSPARFCPFKGERIAEAADAGEAIVAGKQSESEPASVEENVEAVAVASLGSGDEIDEKEDEGLVFLAPFEEQYGVHTVPDLREPETSSSRESSRSTSSPPETLLESAPPEEAEKADAPLVDDGGPLIFEFESPNGEIVSADRPKIDFAVERAQRPRSIVYVTGYSDYRGDFDANQKLAQARANKIKDLIFANEVADKVTAEVKTRGDLLSQKRPGKESEEQLRRSRRVVVEVYHLK